MGIKKANPRTKGVPGTMMVDFSDYDLEELYEILSNLKDEIREKEDKLRDNDLEQELSDISVESSEYLEAWETIG